MKRLISFRMLKKVCSNLELVYRTGCSISWGKCNIKNCPIWKKLKKPKESNTSMSNYMDAK